MDSVGSRLKKARLERNLTIDEVYKKTRIHTNILMAIEEDRLSTLSPVYTKGFLKLYAQFLGIDPKEVIADYQEPKRSVETIEKAQERSEPLAKEPLLKLCWIKPYLNWKFIGSLILGFVFLILVFKLGKFISQRRLGHKEEIPKTATIKPNKKIEKPTQAPLERKVINQAINLTIRAKEDCWISLKVDGRTIFQRVLKRGFAESWVAKEKMELAVGNAAGIELQVNGKNIPPLGKRNQPVKNIVITKEGLSISR